ncbi:hypothetical protein QVD17_02869 [Tagetes erecta]|uniref:Uncharacterized protein n=1 Tax=Tagetes erecta TaxID=13708 RepID=A0AAD8L7C6_TARER|nr:hypothetical protein QVD17_02869 [Tagetes erecta]
MAKGDEETGLFFRRSLENGVVLDIYDGFSNVAHKDNGVMNEANGDDDTDSEGSNEDDDNVDGDHSVHEVDGIVNEANGDDYTDVLEAELDNEKFYSDSDSDTNDTRIRRHNLHNLRRSNENMGNENMANFYLGQVFGTKEEAKELIKSHIVETRRKIKIVKYALLFWPSFSLFNTKMLLQPNVNFSLKNSDHIEVL